MPKPQTTSDIISNEEIERVHAHANFGSMSKRRVVDDGIIKAAYGYGTGHTQQQILLEHGLIEKPKPSSHRMVLTQKGYEYLRLVLPYDFNGAEPQYVQA